MTKGWTKESMARLYPTDKLRAMHRGYLVHRCQARFRNEPYDLTEQEYFDIWQAHWAQRGRAKDQLTMTRIDESLGWSSDNVEIMTRAEHLRRSCNFNRG